MTLSTPTAFLAEIDALIEKRSLLKHPFYQLWTRGELTLDALRGYACQYYHHVLAFPQYVSGAHAICPDQQDRQFMLENLIEEERGEENHPELWLRFGAALGLTREEMAQSQPLPETERLIQTYRRLTKDSSFPEAVTALYVYESQVPEVARQKIDGLERFYGIRDERGTAFFTVHMEADVWHSQQEREILARHANTEDAQTAARRSASTCLDALWGFLDGVCRQYVPEAMALS